MPAMALPKGKTATGRDGFTAHRHRLSFEPSVKGLREAAGDQTIYLRLADLSNTAKRFDSTLRSVETALNSTSKKFPNHIGGT
jgi:hypothetical protein